MNDPKSLSSVEEFHRLFNHPVLDEPAIPDSSRCRLRIALLREELEELEDAINKEDIIGIADALCDLQYVLSGAVLEFGLGYRFKELFDEVQRSNMSKACQTTEEAEATLRHYRAKGVSCYYEEKDGVYLVYREGDKKTLKSVFYSEADLGKILGH
jgi:predicted HAD superfamily Cof-like phosphohydrolase